MTRQPHEDEDTEERRNLLQSLQMIENSRTKSFQSGEMAKTSIWLPDEMLEWLQAEGAKRGIGMAGEIRRRLAVSWHDDLEGIDGPTARLLSVLRTASHEVSEAFAPWHEDPFAFAVLKEILSRTLAVNQPPGEPKPLPRSKDWAEAVLGPGPYTVEKIAQFVMGTLFAAGYLPRPEKQT